MPYKANEARRHRIPRARYKVANWLAKHVLQAHGADQAGRVVFRKRLRRDKVLEFFASQPRCLVAMEACGGAHYWAREISRLGHEVRLIPASYVKPFVKRQKNDMADAEAICEAAKRPTMRFVAVKSEEQQASAVVFRARDLLVRQRTQLINALRGHLAEHGMAVAQGPSHVAKLIPHVEDPAIGLPDAARSTLGMLIEVLARSSWPPWNANCWTTAASAPRPRRAWRSSATSRAGAPRAAGTPPPAICH